MRDPKEFPEQLLADLRELLEDQDADDVVPILITMACGSLFIYIEGRGDQGRVVRRVIIP